MWSTTGSDSSSSCSSNCSSPAALHDNSSLIKCSGCDLTLPSAVRGLPKQTTTTSTTALLTPSPPQCISWGQQGATIYGVDACVRSGWWNVPAAVIAAAAVAAAATASVVVVLLLLRPQWMKTVTAAASTATVAVHSRGNRNLRHDSGASALGEAVGVYAWEPIIESSGRRSSATSSPVIRQPPVSYPHLVAPQVTSHSVIVTAPAAHQRSATTRC